MNPDVQEAISSLPDRPLTAGEVALFFQVNKTTIYRWYGKGDLKGTNINGILRIYRKSVIALIEYGNGKHRDEENTKEVEAKIAEVQTKTRPRRQISGWVTSWKS